MVRATFVDQGLLKMNKYLNQLFVRSCSLMAITGALLFSGSFNLSASAQYSRTELTRDLSSANSVVLYSLEPGDSGRRDDNGECIGLCYYGWPVLGQVGILSKYSIVKQVTLWLKNPEPPEQALCFNPRHGVRITTNASIIDLVVCFECDAVEIYFNSIALEVTAYPQNIQAEWDRLLKKSGVKLAEPLPD